MRATAYRSGLNDEEDSKIDFSELTTVLTITVSTLFSSLTIANKCDDSSGSQFFLVKIGPFSHKGSFLIFRHLFLAWLSQLGFSRYLYRTTWCAELVP